MVEILRYVSPEIKNDVWNYSACSVIRFNVKYCYVQYYLILCVLSVTHLFFINYLCLLSAFCKFMCSYNTHTVMPITQKLVNNMTELPGNDRVLLKRQTPCHTPEKLWTLVMMWSNDDHFAHSSIKETILPPSIHTENDSAPDSHNLLLLLQKLNTNHTDVLKINIKLPYT